MELNHDKACKRRVCRRPKLKFKSDSFHFSDMGSGKTLVKDFLEWRQRVRTMENRESF